MKKTVSFFRNLISRDNKGYTLVEMICAIAILSMVSICVVGFINLCTKTYKSDTTEVNLQYEAQQTVNQLKELIVDANRGVNFIDDASETALMIYNEEEYVLADGTTSYRYPVVKIQYDSTTRTLSYGLKTFMSVSAISSGSYTAAEMKLFGEYVTDFDVNLANVANDEVKFSISFESSEREYSTQPTVSMRNKIIASDNLDEIYTGNPVVRASYVLGVSIYKNGTRITSDDLNKTSSEVIVKYDATVDAIGMSDEVQWVLEHATSSYVDADGTLHLKPDETSTLITLVAKSKADPTKSASVAITVPLYDTTKGYVDTLTISGPEGGTTPHVINITYQPATGSGRTYYYDERMPYINEDKLSASEKGVEWSYQIISDGSRPDFRDGFSFDYDTGKMTCNYKASGASFQIIATSKAKDINGNRKVTTSPAIVIDSLTEPGGVTETTAYIEWGADIPNVVSRNYSYSILANAVNMTDTTYTWSYQGLTGFNASVIYDIYDPDYIEIEEDYSGYYGGYYGRRYSRARLSIGADLGWDRAYTFSVTVKATGKVNGRTETVEATRVFTIPKVSIVLSSSDTTIKYDSINAYNDYYHRDYGEVEFTAELTGYKLSGRSGYYYYAWATYHNKNKDDRANLFEVTRYGSTYYMYMNGSKNDNYKSASVYLFLEGNYGNHVESNTLEFRVDYSKWY